MKFTVFTPTYNRGYVLERLYRSLLKQTNKEFEWIIIDDGSTDETEKIVHQWMKEENGFPIIYKYKENAGKPRAINDCVKLANGKYFFIVDSDDVLIPEAIEKMSKWCNEIDNDPIFVGVGAARGFSEKEYIAGKSPFVNECGYVDATNLERSKYNFDADMCEAYKTEILKQFPFQVWEGEKFAPEQITMNEMALQGYKVRWHKEIIYLCEYLEDGLTKGSQRLIAENPMGYAMMFDHMLKYHQGLKKSFYSACQMNALAIYGKHLGYAISCNNKLLGIISWPIGFILACRREKQFKNINECNEG